MPIQVLSWERIVARVLEELQGVNLVMLVLVGFGCIIAVSIFRCWLTQHGKPNWPDEYRKAKCIAFLLWYLTFILDVTLMRRIGTTVHGSLSIPFGWVGKGWYAAFYAVGLDALNVLLFVPLATSIACSVKGMRRRTILTVLLCLVLSLGIEVLQLAFQIGTFETEDVIFNATGGLIGAMFGGFLNAREHSGKGSRGREAAISRQEKGF